MKKILGIVASQRKLANGEILTKEVSRAAGDDCELELIRLADLNLELCRACYTCLIPGKQCPLNDDMYFLLEKIKAADAIILSAPDYVLGPAGVTKVWADRMIAMVQHIDDLWGKPCVVIATYGIEGWQGYTLSALTAMVQFMGLNLKDSHMFFGALPGEGVSNPEALARAREMGHALFGEARSAKNGECPTCRSEIWKFPEPAKAVCSICGQTATLYPEEKGLKWVYGESKNPFEKEHLKEHFQGWLRGKVQEFISRRKELALVRDPYKGNDTWLIPHKE
ncbi:flavodoxin family protein [Desulfitobacterium metallireducens]|uniref:NADPH-dependent FMN reductase n=1 Tax=Desulfitobacterium metallireducens DSM 15288 TaxID=871968 RepID=W0E9J0_9FIRM|nr:flavodoxin family protein [Desulfitobacterium metallireducens]AHF07432.1 NADPH-dependent FMN reductase [Desulfitobacterium metallireducens DSM 15288]